VSQTGAYGELRRAFSLGLSDPDSNRGRVSSGVKRSPALGGLRAALRDPAFCFRVAARVRHPADPDLTGTDRAGMLPLPPGPLQLGWRISIRLGKDYYVRPGTSDCSAGPSAIGRIVDVSADLERVASAWTAASSPATPGSGPARGPSATRSCPDRQTAA
jgi:hypothetical protein